ncbi:hypothetical protein [Dyadobacter sp. CY312]|uniref:hypothetical protein n=1 Tax=Dyadobacter sp. CY312 TaxID=2907303 RepID=UPI001F35F36B|nr:hypothetical protein [Dyadobacter sp. CY312]MCE7039088.1 hypothetical protein [Dyadobacter sp. CY312]
MKNRQNSYLKTSSIGLFLLLSIIGTSCSKKFTFSESVIVPAAQGSVKFKKDKNDNYAVNLVVHNLSEPGRLVESRNTYVVWTNTDNKGVKNLGQLKNASGLFSKNLKSELKTTTPFKPTGFFITAENQADISIPRGQVVLTTR